jgi:hypothetical protein
MYARQRWLSSAKQKHERFKANDGETIQRSANFRYLGIILHETRGMSCAIDSRAPAARKAMWALFPRFKLAGITDIAIKLRMFSYLVVPIMEYCSTM